FIAFRPAAGFRRTGMARYLAPINAQIAELYGLAARKFGDAHANCPLGIEQIEQVTFGISLRRTPHNGQTLRTVGLHALMVRTVEPFKWEKSIRAWWPQLSEGRVGDQVYCKVQNVPELGKEVCFYFPDERTIVWDNEKELIQLIQRKGPPEFIRSAQWG